MKKLAFLVLGTAAFAAPAHATDTLTCRGTANPRVRLDLSIGHLVGGVVAQAALTEGNASLITGQGQATLAQAWIDDRQLLVEVLDGNSEARIVELRTTRRGTRGAYAGTMKVRGRTHRVRCRYEEG